MAISKWSRRSSAFFVYLALCTSIFQGAAISGGAFPILATVVSSFIFIVHCVIQHNRLVTKVKISRFEYEYQKFLLPLVIYSVLSAFVFPIIFSGILVYVPKNGISIAPNGILKFNISTFGQSIYMVFNYILLVCLARYNYSDNKINITKPLQIMGVIAALFSIYQLISVDHGLYYPTEILNSNTFSSQETMQRIPISTGQPRISGVFTEPSYNGNFLGMFFVFYLIRTIWKVKIYDLLLLTLFLVATAITTSSTGYIEVIFGVVVYSCFVVAGVFAKNTINKSVAGLLPILIIIFAVIIVAFKGEILIELINKNSSGSFMERNGSDRYTWQLLAETFGLGVGLGGNRPSSFLMYILSNIGIPGIILFAGFLLTVANPLIRNFRILNRDQKALVFAFGALFLGKCIGIPDFSSQYFWVILAMVIVQAQFAAKDSRNRIIHNEYEINGRELGGKTYMR